jgi:DNA replication and repair protein RecF
MITEIVGDNLATTMLLYARRISKIRGKGIMISKIHLQNFRNFKYKTLSFSDKNSIIVGPNASGKTNILESLFLIATGRSFRARLEEEMIGYNAEIARISGRISNNELRTIVKNTDKHGSFCKEHNSPEVILTRGEIKIGENKFEKAPRKRLLINGVGKHLIDFIGNFRVVLFGPWDLDLVTESPSLRRRFLDTVLSQVDRDYHRASLSYEKGLRQRNRLLWQIREEASLDLGRARLLFWDKLLIKNGDYISKVREEFIDFVNERPNFKGQNFSLEYDKSAISEARLAQYKDEEIAAATTLVGPHRDDFVIRLKTVTSKPRNRERELARFGSRGEQRMGVLWLKLAELSFIEERTQDKPTLLLDDIFSELDHEHRKIVMQASKGQQTIITTADPHFIKYFKVDSIINLNGK